MSYIPRGLLPSRRDLGHEEVELLKGTTTIGIKCVDGIVIASDRRASMATFIASKRALKTIKISDRVVATISGSVADGQFLTNNLKAVAKLYELEFGRAMSVRAIARRLALILWSYRPVVLIAHIMVGGIDESGSHLFNVDPLGTLTEEDFIATGSGSPVAISVIEEQYNPEMNVEEGKKLVISAMLSALERDMATGNGIDVTVVDERGVHFLEEKEIQDLIEKVKAIR
ncbi:MAG: proteasome subunit beta [Thermoproteota archaeon]|nr:MAG: proteasome subunit beta [Candidatus Korarchaeota archaeon]